MTQIQIDALEHSIIAAWNKKLFTPTTNSSLNAVMARTAALEVVDALRANPAWCRVLGIGDSQ